MTQRISRKFLEAQCERVSAMIPGASELELSHDGGGWTLYQVQRSESGTRWLHKVAYGRTASVMSDALDAVEEGIRLAVAP